LSSSNSKIDTENVKTLQKNKLLTSITEFKGKSNSSRPGQSEEEFSQSNSYLEENTFTRKMNDASNQERKLMKKLEISTRENEELMTLLKQSDSHLV